VTEREQVLTRSAETVVLGAALLMLAIASDGDHWVTAGVAGLLFSALFLASILLLRHHPPTEASAGGRPPCAPSSAAEPMRERGSASRPP